MKICRNCRTINDDNVVACARCKMRDQLVDYNPEKTREWQASMHTQNNVEERYNVCLNCGTRDYGNNTKCDRCRFPLNIKKRNTANRW